MALLAVPVDGLVGQLERRAREGLLVNRIVALRAVGGKGRMMLRDRAGIVDGLAVAKIKIGHRRPAEERDDQDGEETEPPPVVALTEVAEVALKALGNLFLRSSIERHIVFVARAATVKTGGGKFTIGKPRKQMWRLGP